MRKTRIITDADELVEVEVGVARHLISVGKAKLAPEGKPAEEQAKPEAAEEQAKPARPKPPSTR